MMKLLHNAIANPKCIEHHCIPAPQDREHYCCALRAAHCKGMGQNLAISLCHTVSSPTAKAAKVHLNP